MNDENKNRTPQADDGFPLSDDSDVRPVELKKKGRKKANVIILIVILLAIACCIGYVLVTVINNFMAVQSYGELNEIVTAAQEVKEDESTVNVEGDDTSGYSPVDLPALQKINSDVYCWLRVPGTYIDYPVAQSTVEDNYYLHRSIYKRYLFAGMIYTQSCNKKDFSDPITVIYGHNMRSTTMFSSLHYFEKADFFKEHEFFYIYTVDRVLTYRVISAYKYDNRHIMNSFNFSDPDVLGTYQHSILNPVSTVRNVRDDVTLDENSKIIVLSTCMSNDKKSRFLVNGVLVSDVPIEKAQ